MRTLAIYKTYSFKAKDPVIDELRELTRKSGKKERLIALDAGLSPTTPTGWFKGKVRRPQSASVEAYGRAAGFRRKWVPLNAK